jgi:hypothetical protein
VVTAVAAAARRLPKRDSPRLVLEGIEEFNESERYQYLKETRV